MIACEKTNNGATIRTLLTGKDVNINAQDHNGYTAMHFAAINNNREGVTVLLDHIPDLTILTKAGKTAAALAEDRHHYELAEDLIMNMSRMEYEQKMDTQTIDTLTDAGKTEATQETQETQETPDKSDKSDKPEATKDSNVVALPSIEAQAEDRAVILQISPPKDENINTEKYVKMIDYGLTLITIEHKMKLDGLTSKQIEIHMEKVRESLKNKNESNDNQDNKDNENDTEDVLQITIQKEETQPEDKKEETNVDNENTKNENKDKKNENENETGDETITTVSNGDANDQEEDKPNNNNNPDTKNENENKDENESDNKEKEKDKENENESANKNDREDGRTDSIGLEESGAPDQISPNDAGEQYVD